MLRCSNFSKGTSMPMLRLPMTLLLLLIRWRLSSCLFQIEDDVRCSPDIIEIVDKYQRVAMR